MSNIQPLVCVIITNYNYGHYLDDAINSIKNQTFKDFEIILIDDCSTQETSIKKIEELKNDPQLKVIVNKDNRGVVYSRNHAITHTNCEYVIFMDADDQLENTALQKMYQKTQDYDVISCGYKEFGDRTKVSKNNSFDKYTLCHKAIIHNSSLFKKSFFEKCGGYNDNMKYGFEDHDLWLSMCEAGARFYILKEPLLRYRIKIDSRNITAVNSHGQDLNENIIKNHPRLFTWYLGETRRKMQKFRRLKRITLGLGLLNLLLLTKIFFF